MILGNIFNFEVNLLGNLTYKIQFITLKIVHIFISLNYKIVKMKNLIFTISLIFVSTTYSLSQINKEYHLNQA